MMMRTDLQVQRDDAVTGKMWMQRVGFFLRVCVSFFDGALWGIDAKMIGWFGF